MKPFKKFLKINGYGLIIFAVLVGIVAVYNTIALKSEADRIIPNGEMVDLGDYKVHVYSEGDESKELTLVFLSGSGTVAPVYDFKVLYSLLTDEYRAAVVEKAGYGYSDIVVVERDINSVLSELRSALTKAGIQGPYILIPHSMSGLEALYWAQKYPDEVKGIVGIDMAVPDSYDDFDFKQIDRMKFLGKLSTKLGLTRIPGLYPLSKLSLTDKETEQQVLLMHRNALNPVFISEGEYIFENAQTVKQGGEISCPILLFASDGSEVGDSWVSSLTKFAEENDADLIAYDSGHYLHHSKSNEMAMAIKEFLLEMGY